MTRESRERRVGVEIEFIGPEFDTAVQAAADAMGADVERVSDYQCLLRGDLADEPFRLEVDFRLLHTLAEQGGDEAEPLRDTALDLLGTAASAVVPLEFVTPPIGFDRVDDLVPVVEALESVGAVGTQESWIYAFGVHFNPGVPAQETGAILPIVQAFACLHDWLRERDRMNLTRTLIGFADPFPRKYEQRILDPDYAPAMGELIDDYLEFNATRNRALDLLPLFAFLDDARVRSVVDDDLIKPRPTFHYRLPNSNLGDPQWSLLRPWSDWLTLEKLARDEALLRHFRTARLEFLGRFRFLDASKDWIATCDELLKDLA